MVARIDEVEFFSRALSAGEIFNIYNAGTFGKCKPVCTPPPANMISWFQGEGNEATPSTVMRS